MINQTHLNEWTIASAVLQEIVQLNVQSINKVEGYSPSSLLFDLLHPNPKRLNSGRLDASGVRQFDNCLETSGWWVSGIDPFTWETMEWGRFKPDLDTPLSQPYFNKQTGKEEKAPKYRSPAGTLSRLVFLRVPDSIWQKISDHNNIPISEAEKHHPGGFWHWVMQHKELPIILTEGEKKAGCLLSLGYVAIPLPGIWMARRYDDNVTKINEHIIPDLALFTAKSRPVTIIFDHDVKLKTKINVYKATIATAQLLAKSGCQAQVGTLPSVANGKNAIDDFVVAGGDIGQIINKAVDWEIYKENRHPCNWKNPSTNLTIKGTAISFGKTTDEFLSGNKTVTRRVWKNSHAQKFLDDWDIKPGEFIYPALNKGYHVGGKRVGYIRLTHKPYQEMLADMPASDLAAEGFPDLSKQEFIERFFEGNDQQTVWVLRFELVSERDQGAAQTKASDSDQFSKWIQKRAEKLKDWWREQRKYTPTITQNQKYTEFPEIPENCIFETKAGTGTGKTYQMEQMFKAPYIDKKAGIYEEPGPFYFDGAMMIAARNSLLLQNSKRLGFKHLQGDKCFHLLYEPKSKVALCSNSLPHILDPKWFDNKVVVLDEAMELLQHLLLSKTHKNHAQTLNLWSECLKRAKVIILLDANLADWAVDEYIINLAGRRKVIKLENQYKNDRAPVEFLIGTPTKKSKLTENIEKGLKEKGLNSRDISPYISAIMASKKRIIFTDSQRNAETIDYILTNLCGLKGLRIDSKTVAEKGSYADKFMSNPDAIIKSTSPDFVVCSPTVQSGVDISIKDYFTDSYGLFFGVVGTNTQLQMMGRLRDPNIKWHIACPEYTRKNNENFGSPIVKELMTALKDYLIQDAAIITKTLPQLFDHIKELIETKLKDNPHHDAWAKLKAIENYEKANLRECLIEVLTKAGHEIKFVELQHDDNAANILSESKEAVLIKESKEIHSAPDIDIDKVKELQSNFEATWEDRCKIIKAGYKDRLPGIENSKFWKPELIYTFRENQNFISQSELHYFLYNPQHLQEQQQELWGYLALGGMKFLADVRSRHLRIKALEKLGIKEILESGKSYSSKSPEILEMLKLARRSKKMSAALGVVPGKDAIKYLRKVLELIGFSLTAKKSNGFWSYQVTQEKGEIRDSLAQCLIRKYSSVSNIKEQKSSKWEEAKSAFCISKINLPSEVPQIEAKHSIKPREDLRNIVINPRQSSLEKIANLPEPSPEIYRGETAIYQDDMEWTADALELMIGTPPQQQPDLSPLEVFKYQIQEFGWDVIKEAAKLNEALASKVIGLVEQLVEGGEWHFAPG